MGDCEIRYDGRLWDSWLWDKIYHHLIIASTIHYLISTITSHLPSHHLSSSHHPPSHLHSIFTYPDIHDTGREKLNRHDQLTRMMMVDEMMVSCETDIYHLICLILWSTIINHFMITHLIICLMINHLINHLISWSTISWSTISSTISFHHLTSRYHLQQQIRDQESQSIRDGRWWDEMVDCERDSWCDEMVSCETDMIT